MKPGSVWELMAFDILTQRDKEILDRFYSARNYGGAESWLQKKMLPVWRAKISLLPEYANR